MNILKRRNENLNPNDEKRKKKRPLQHVWLQHDVFNSQWKKIGKVSALLIYPVKSSVEAVRYDSCAFFDYGMCKMYRRVYFYDGMFVVYNKTNHKFEDARKYPLLQHMRADDMGIERNKAILSGNGINNVRVNIRYNYNYPTFREETWKEVSELFRRSNQQINRCVKQMIAAESINQADEDIILAQIIPNDWRTMDKIRQNWSRFVQGYETMEEDETGKLITLPRFVLMTLKTHTKLLETGARIAPNVIIDTDELMNPFEEKNWDLIKFGNDVILKKVKPVPRDHINEEFEHRGIYCGLLTGGVVKENDNVFIHTYV